MAAAALALLAAAFLITTRDSVEQSAKELVSIIVVLLCILEVVFDLLLQLLQEVGTGTSRSSPR
jgi:hypothetical protein